jgi:hypothetical protein
MNAIPDARPRLRRLQTATMDVLGAVGGPAAVWIVFGGKHFARTAGATDTTDLRAALAAFGVALAGAAVVMDERPGVAGALRRGSAIGLGAVGAAAGVVVTLFMGLYLGLAPCCGGGGIAGRQPTALAAGLRTVCFKHPAVYVFGSTGVMIGCALLPARLWWRACRPSAVPLPERSVGLEAAVACGAAAAVLGLAGRAFLLSPFGIAVLAFIVVGLTRSIRPVPTARRDDTAA